MGDKCYDSHIPIAHYKTYNLPFCKSEHNQYVFYLKISQNCEFWIMFYGFITSSLLLFFLFFYFCLFCFPWHHYTMSTSVQHKSKGGAPSSILRQWCLLHTFPLLCLFHWFFSCNWARFYLGHDCPLTMWMSLYCCTRWGSGTQFVLFHV